MTARECLKFNLKILRKAKGYNSAQSLAAKADLSTVTIAKIESKKGHFPDENTIEKIAKALGVDEAELFKNPNCETSIPLIPALKRITDAVNLIAHVPTEVLFNLRDVKWGSENVSETARLFFQTISHKDKKQTK